MLEDSIALPGIQTHSWEVASAAHPRWTDVDPALQMDSNLGF